MSFHEIVWLDFYSPLAVPVNPVKFFASGEKPAELKGPEARGDRLPPTDFPFQLNYPPFTNQ